MDRLADLEAFLTIVERGSQAAAARHLRRSLQSINRSLIAVEESVGVELVRRTTRQSSPTAAGLAFYQRIKPAFAEINEARLTAGEKRVEPSGLLRIGAPILFAPAYVVPAVNEVIARHPQIEIALKASDREVDFFESNLDLAIRIRDLPPSGLKVRKLGEMRTVVIGAPAYFARHGRPKHPKNLTSHQCILRTSDGNTDAWPFRIDGRRRLVRVQGRFRTDSAAATHAAAASGLGLAFAPLWQVRGLVDQGAVKIILEDYEAAKLPVYAVSAPTKLPDAKARLFIDVLAGHLKKARL